MWPSLASISQRQCFRNSRNLSFGAIQEFIWTLFRISPRFLRFESRHRHRHRHRHRCRNRPITRLPIFLLTATRKIVSPWFFVQKKVPNFFEPSEFERKRENGKIELCLHPGLRRRPGLGQRPRQRESRLCPFLQTDLTSNGCIWTRGDLGWL